MIIQNKMCKMKMDTIFNMLEQILKNKIFQNQTSNKTII